MGPIAARTDVDPTAGSIEYAMISHRNCWEVIPIRTWRHTDTLDLDFVDDLQAVLSRDASG
jgi:hypothetical protein